MHSAKTIFISILGLEVGGAGAFSKTGKAIQQNIIDRLGTSDNLGRPGWAIPRCPARNDSYNPTLSAAHAVMTARRRSLG